MSSSLHCSVSLPSSFPKLSNFKTINKFFPFNPSNPSSIHFSSSSFSTIKCSTSSSSTSLEETAMSIDNLRSFFNLNIGKWNGSFYQFDAGGKLLQQVSTKLSVSSYGEDELMSLLQSLYIKQPSSNTLISGDNDDVEWAEYKIKETNMFTVDKYQQIGFFPSEKAFALRYQTVGMLETVLRQGILGEDDTGEESPKNLKIPSRRPSIVCENCLYSLHRDMRARAFHILEPKGTVDMLIVFLEEKSEGSHPLLESAGVTTNRITPFLGKWKGHSITKRSGVYGSTISEADTVVLHEMNDNGQLIQDATSTTDPANVTTNVRWTGTVSDNLVTFDGGYQMILLPGGMYMGSPCDISKSVAQWKSFHLEFCWLETPDKRQRLVRTFDIEGLAVSSTYFYETKL
ncbi:unnamed protein product [Lathyrus oleraceus]|uniref:DUF3598 domain-containing protein n=3 Tax=Pisum sativum TaxID=3888 RepID=A0A9D5GVJ3_PEA|nr:uncharacterized protein LOC127121867 isoform X1 [Pisum sativum]KAI5442907.1 hypothetical protein KIW84_011804 [Pisum sativum]